MANPTTNFGWVMPTATDLVTDLPADFNVFGQGVDTSMQDLLGGTTGQVLSKTSNTNMDFTWIAAPTPPFVGCSLYKSAAQTISNTTFTAITFNSESFDTDAFHNDTTNNSRITIPTGKGGKYLVTLFANTVSVNPSYIILSLYLNGAQYTASGLREGTVFRNDGQIPISASTVVTLAAADYLEFYFQQSETATANMYFQFTAIYLGA